MQFWIRAINLCNCKSWYNSVLIPYVPNKSPFLGLPMMHLFARIIRHPNDDIGLSLPLRQNPIRIWPYHLFWFSQLIPQSLCDIVEILKMCFANLLNISTHYHMHCLPEIILWCWNACIVKYGDVICSCCHWVNHPQWKICVPC